MSINPNTQAAEGIQGPKSIIEIVNGGINLPVGVEQIFFTSNDGTDPDANSEKN